MKRTAMPPRRTPLDRGTAELRRTGFRPDVSSGEAGTAGRRIRRRTAARAAEERLYLARSREWLAGKVCARCGTTEGLTVQHLRGRQGRLLLDERHWMALCWDPCHEWATTHPAEAIAQGFSSSRLANRETAQHE